jgi:uncharacterized protein YggE
MSRRSLAWAPVLAALTCAAPALAQTDQSQSVTATGSAEIRVAPANRHSNASIASAVDAAQKAAVPAALTAAHARALIYAQDAGLTLGPLLAVSDAGTSPFGPYGPGVLNGPFGPGKYCGTERRPVFKRVGNRLKLVRVRKVHACYVPRFATATLTVTYSAT